MRERHQVHPASDGIIDVSELRLMIAEDHQSKLRSEGEEILTHEACTDRVTTGQAFDS